MNIATLSRTTTYHLWIELEAMPATAALPLTTKSKLLYTLGDAVDQALARMDQRARLPYGRKRPVEPEPRILMHDVTRAFQRAGVKPTAWQGETGESVLFQVYRICSGLAGFDAPKDLRKPYRNSGDVTADSGEPPL